MGTTYHGGMGIRHAFVLAPLWCACVLPAEPVLGTALDSVPQEAQKVEAVSLRFVRSIDHGNVSYRKKGQAEPTVYWQGWSGVFQLHNPTQRELRFWAQGLGTPLSRVRLWHGDQYVDDPESDCGTGFDYYSIFPGETLLFQARMNEDRLGELQLQMGAWFVDNKEEVELWSQKYKFQPKNEVL
jgi:hypothetical protein